MVLFLPKDFTYMYFKSFLMYLLVLSIRYMFVFVAKYNMISVNQWSSTYLSASPPNQAMGTNGVKMMSCSLCELWALWFQLSLKLLERIAPGGETKVCDMPDVSEYQFEKSLEEALTICKTNDVKSKKNKGIMDRGMSKHKRITKVRIE